MEKDKLYAKAISKYQRQWVALSGRKVVASGNSLQEVKAAVEKKHIKNYFFHFVPPSSVSLAPF
jgi:hypothetical protein